MVCDVWLMVSGGTWVVVVGCGWLWGVCAGRGVSLCGLVGCGVWCGRGVLAGLVCDVDR